MSYLGFLVWFVIAPGIALVASLHQVYRGNTHLRRHWGGTAILALIAIVWTTPWDSAIINHNVWYYGADRVLGTLFSVPIEEYAFMVLMPFLNGSVIAWFLLRSGVAPTRWRDRQTGARRALLLGALLLCVAGGLCLRTESGTYLGAILVWFIPPLAIQSCFDPSLLRHHWRGLAAGTLLPAGYLSLADAFAIREGTWTIQAPTRTGIEFAGLPMEEALFFFVISLLIAQGLYLWHSLFTESIQ
jgi:lycopene cyclase domain-containing protein